MKKFNFMLVAAVMFIMSAINVNAQNAVEQTENIQTETENVPVKTDNGYHPKHEIHASIGMWGFTETANGIGSFFSSLAGQEHKEGTFCNFNLGYGYHITDKLIAGVNISYARTAFSLEDDKAAVENNGKTVEDHISIMPSVKYNWINKPHFALYSRLAGGVRLELANQEVDGKKESITRSRFTYQVSPVGIEFGGKNIRGFAELGWGQSGIGQVGIRACF